jgi:hypothetical protein
MRKLSTQAKVLLTPAFVYQDIFCSNSPIVTVRFQPLASAPILKNRVFKISASQKFETVVKFLRKKLDCKETDSVFCYVNSVFAPGLDEGVGGLWRVRTSLSHYVIWDRSLIDWSYSASKLTTS